MGQVTPLLKETGKTLEETAADEFEMLVRLGFPADQADTTTEQAPPVVPVRGKWISRLRARGRNLTRDFVADDRGAVTAEYALVIMAS